MPIQVLLYGTFKDRVSFFVRNLICCFNEEFDKTLAIFCKAVQILNKGLARLGKLRKTG